MRKRFIAGNWKMNMSVASAREYAEELKKEYAKSDTIVAVAAPFTQLAVLSEAFSGTEIKVAAQNMHFESSGAYTGEVSPEMLLEVGAEYVIIGHSERREYFGETDASVSKKLKKAFEVGLRPILCVGEDLAQREAGKACDFVKSQLTADLEGLSEDQIFGLTVAYEPIWAIGTGKTASAEQAQEMCRFIRDVVSEKYPKAAGEMLIQYGGSVKASNASELLSMPDIDGALVGGASLKVSDFTAIIRA